MPLRLEIQRKLSATSERVKCCDIHPTEPWILSALFSGHCFIWNYQTQVLVKTFEVCDLPVRTAKFIPKKQWIVCGSDDMHIRVYNYNTMERVHAFEAHTDYIRCIAVHPTSSLILSSSDDMFIKMWDWEKGWECTQVFEGHTHYVMQVEFNPKDTNTFASASLDRSVKVWGLNSGTPHFSLEGHDRGVNCIAYFRGGDRPYLVSGADDHLVKIWDYQTKSCIATLDGHTNNVSAVVFHPHLPVILSGSEDGTVRIWHSTTYRLENTLNYGMGRVWSISAMKNSNKVAIGYDDGTIMIKLGHEEPVVSMDASGKIVWAKNHEIVTANVKKNVDSIVDGEVIPVSTKEMGSCEIYPQSLQHSPNGRLICVCGDGEYIIYTALALKNKSFGHALEFVWAFANGAYATRESSQKVKVFKNFAEHKQFRPAFAAEGVFGGYLLGVRSSDFIDFYDWDECRVIRRIDVCPNKVYWSESGDVVVIACENSYYVLRYNRELVQKFLDQNIEIGEQGIENSFDLEQEVGEKIRTGYFVGDCFIYTNTAGRLNYYVGGEVMTLAHLDKSMYILGYQPKHNRVYLMDKQYNLFSYQLLVSVLVYQTAVVRQDFEAAEKALTEIPKDHYNRIAHFLEGQNLKEMALQVSNDPEHKFELALALKQLQLAREVLLESESAAKWKQLGDLALAEDFDLPLAEECFTRASDLGSLLLLYSSTCDRQGMERLSTLSKDSGRNNIAFICLFLLGKVDECIDLLCHTGRIPEAAFMARTYAPSRIPQVLTLWKEDLKQVSKRAAESLADPTAYPDRFPYLAQAMKVETWVRRNNTSALHASSYTQVKPLVTRDLIQEMKNGQLGDLNMPKAAARASAVPIYAPISSPRGEKLEVPEATPAPTANGAPRGNGATSDGDNDSVDGRDVTAEEPEEERPQEEEDDDAFAPAPTPAVVPPSRTAAAPVANVAAAAPAAPTHKSTASTASNTSVPPAVTASVKSPSSVASFDKPRTTAAPVAQTAPSVTGPKPTVASTATVAAPQPAATRVTSPPAAKRPADDEDDPFAKVSAPAKRVQDDEDDPFATAVAPPKKTPPPTATAAVSAAPKQPAPVAVKSPSSVSSSSGAKVSDGSAPKTVGAATPQKAAAPAKPTANLDFDADADADADFMDDLDFQPVHSRPSVASKNAAAAGTSAAAAKKKPTSGTGQSLDVLKASLEELGDDDAWGNF